jgi:hypothetical protein
VALGDRPDPSHSFTFRGRQRGPLQGCRALGGLAVQPQDPLEGLVAIVSETVLATSGGLEMAFRCDHNLPDRMLQTTYLDWAAIALVVDLRIIIFPAESGQGSLQKRGFIDP